VLIESCDFVKRDVLTQVLSRNGYSVQACGGPEAMDAKCALVSTGTCEGVAGADVIVHSMRHSDHRNREVLHELREQHPDTPVVVEVPRPVVDQYPGDFENCRVVPQPMTSNALLEALDEVLAD
jgi:CheY-like chemotaxis protein